MTYNEWPSTLTKFQLASREDGKELQYSNFHSYIRSDSFEFSQTCCWKIAALDN